MTEIRISYDEEDIWDWQYTTSDALVDQIIDWLGDNWKYVLVGIAAIAALVIVSKLLSAIGGIIGLLSQVLKAVIGASGFILKYLAIGIFYVLKTVVYWIPLGILRLLYFLIVPGKYRKKKQPKGVIVYDR